MMLSFVKYVALIKVIFVKREEYFFCQCYVEACVRDRE